ncbi:uncharacterized protein LAJ45_02714 [Morchella importuna]|uniref:uncharacterized protein n=1 Tax=Morchella importuna TaxID=1174673 RepID=UPI001E8D6E7E|nr:uncharacterized protein LAJ45_02714 [Morchella importuna]KAH8153127.1 hypothetical protein LAJ45_02714 [Morchella importuna]
MLSRHDECSHGTANALTAPRMLHGTANVPANAPANAPANTPARASASASRALTNAHRPEAFVIPTQGEATLIGLLWIDTPSSKDRKAAPVPQKISNVGILNAAVRSVRDTDTSTVLYTGATTQPLTDVYVSVDS